MHKFEQKAAKCKSTGTFICSSKTGKTILNYNANSTSNKIKNK